VGQLRGSPAEGQDPFSSGDVPSKVDPQVFFWCLILVLGLLHVWTHRNDVTPDSISYIEIGWATARGGLHQVVNAYWSPLYPFLLSLVFRLFHPTAQWEFTAAHLLNFAVYVASLASFEVFLKELTLGRRGGGESSGVVYPVSSRAVLVWGYLFFLWASFFWLGPEWVTPDLCLSVVVFLATALLLRIRRGRRNLLVFAALGAVLGVGYLAKAAMFPLSFVFLFSAFCLCRIAGASARAAAIRTLLAGGVFAGLALPLGLAISEAKGRPTFGDSGRINYIEFVNRAPRSVHWQGSPAGTGTPHHPTRKIFSNPDVYEFTQPVPGSYPPWYDPSYWYEGARPHFVLSDQMAALFRAANVYLKVFSKSGVLWVVLVAVLALGKNNLTWANSPRGEWLVILPLVAPLVMYALVLVEFRYVAPYALMLLLWSLSKLGIVSGAKAVPLERLQRVVLLVPALAVFWAVANDLVAVIQNKPYEPLVVAQQLHAIGIPAGADVGYVGTGLDAYWAHLAEVRIIAEVPDGEEPRYVAADAARRQQVLALFYSVGARAVITRNAAVAKSEDGWRPIPGTQHFIWQQPWLIAAPEKK
jgi:hypothetical protein